MQLGRSYTVAELIPQGPGMVLLDRLLEYDNESATFEVAIRPDSLFCEAGRGVPAWIGLEYLAQSIGAYEGIVRLQSGRKVQVGLLLGTRRYDSTRPWFPVGARMTARAQLMIRDADGVTAFDCALAENGERIASAQIKAYQPESIDAYLDGLEPQA